MNQRAGVDTSSVDRVTGAMQRAEDRAERESPGWKDDALEAIRLHATKHPEFVVEDIGLVVPEGADPRAVGGIVARAKSAGFIEKAGTVHDSWGSHKAKWRSLIHVASTSPAASPKE